MRHCDLGLIEYAKLRFRGGAAMDDLTIGETIERYLDAVHRSTSSREHHSLLAALSAGVGNEAYRLAVERGLLDYSVHEENKALRAERDDEESSERQNRLLQHALVPLAQKMEELLKMQPGETAPTSSSHDTSHHIVDHGSECVHIIIDETLNKQSIYVTSTSELGEPENCEVAESDSVRNCLFHAGVLAIATRLMESIKAETPVHRSRATVVVGHGVGGTVSLALGILLHASAYDVRNAVSFGSPKAVVQCQSRVAVAVNPIRVVIAGDARADMPISSSEGGTFMHIGESLTMDGVLPAAVEAFSMAHYTALLESRETSLLYGEADDDNDAGDRPTGGDTPRFEPKRSHEEQLRAPE